MMKDFDFFKTGYRVLLLLHRHKDGGATRADYRAVRKITYGKGEFETALEELRDVKAGSLLPYRLYCTINERDFDKAIRHFKGEMLDRDYDAPDTRNGFYIDIKNRFVGSLQRPQSRKTKNWLIDIDYQDDTPFIRYGGHIGAFKEAVEKHTEILFRTHTKNGEHWIVKPFNKLKYNEICGEVKPDLKEDALLYIGDHLR